MVTVAFSVATSPSAIGSPAGEISRITSGETGSLKVSFSVAGAFTTAPSAGSAFTSEACAQTRAPVAGRISSERTSAAARARMARQGFAQQLQPRGRLRIVRRGFSRGRNLRSSGARPSRIPARSRNRALCRLRGRRRGSSRTRTRRRRRRGSAAAPRDLGHALAELGAVKILVGLGVLAGDGVDLPARLEHRLDRDHAFGNAHAQGDRGRAVAAVRHAHHRLVGRADRRFPGFKADMGGRRADAERRRRRREQARESSWISARTGAGRVVLLRD